MNTYKYNIGGYDWGCQTNRIILTMDDVIEEINKEDLIIRETTLISDFKNKTINEIMAKRNISDCRLIDEHNIAIELEVGPEYPSPAVFSFETMKNQWSNPYSLTIHYKDVMINRKSGQATDADCFEINNYICKDGTIYPYGYYHNNSDTLLVWLHGLSEGNCAQNDPKLTILINRVQSLCGKFQDYVSCDLLVPQCPTYWMDEDGKESNLNGGRIIAGRSSYYKESLKKLIESFNKKHIILVGASNGGYMALYMGLEYGDMFDAIIPICEGFPDEYISDEQINKILSIPLFFIYSNDDYVVDPKKFEMPTIERLRNKGVLNLKVATTDHVYFNIEGNKVKTSGHRSWIYFFNNEASDDETGIKVFDWLKGIIK